jgi:predicted dithiol-disulfide oxidoreductase (DUF899 family)
MTTTTEHPIVSREAWLLRRKALLVREKELTQASDQLARERRALPWVRVDKPYVFDTLAGPRSLAELFDGRRQLLVQHFMLGPGWAQGCKSCSFMADHFAAAAVHLVHRGVTPLLVSRAPLAEIERFRQRMGWPLPWVSSHGNDFNADFHVSFTDQQMADGPVDYNYHAVRFPHTEAPGISAFFKDDAGDVFHTYSCYGRGVEVMMGTYPLLDLTPEGRNEPDGGMAWVRHHDRYERTHSPLLPATGGCCGGAA